MRSTAQPPGSSARPDRISGIFLFWQDALAREGPTERDERLAFLQGLGMDTIVVQFSVWEGRAWYRSRHLPPADDWESDPTASLLGAAERAGFGVHLGLASDERNWWGIPYRAQDVPRYVVEEAARNRLIIEELVGQYGGSPALAGIYLSHEIHLGDEWAGGNLPHLVELFNQMSDRVKALAPALVVSTAPFFSLRGTAALFQERWQRFLSRTRLDVLMLQDGVGCERDITVENMVPYYWALARVCAREGVELWSDLELFDLKPPKTVSPERVAAQLAGVAPYVSKIVAYSLANLTPELAASLPGVTR